MTRRLFRISSVSDLRKSAPSSSIHSVAGRPTRAPHAYPSARMKTAFGAGPGAERLTAPANPSCSISQKTERTKSSS